MMPSTSKKQHNFMAAVANNPSFAKKVGVPQSVGKDFSTADKGRKFSKGGDMKESKAMVAKEMSFMKKKGAPKSMMMHEKAESMGMKKGGMPSALAKHAAKPASKAHAGLKEGGMAMVMKDGKKIPAFAADGEGKMKKGGMAKKMKVGGMGYSIGGGIESRGKTKGKII
jgi:hypothetical protein